MPAYTSEDAGIINTTEFPLASRLSLVMRENSKVKLYLVSHCHSWDATKLNNGAGVWQVIAGNGSPPSSRTGIQQEEYTTVIPYSIFLRVERLSFTTMEEICLPLHRNFMKEHLCLLHLQHYGEIW